jgi:hypothetical protein
MGDDVIAFGEDAGRNATGTGCIYIGQSAGETNSQDDVAIIADKNGNARAEIDLATGDMTIEGSLTQNGTL